MTFKSINRGWQGKQTSSFGNFRRDRSPNNPSVIATDIVFNVDAANSLSYPGTGTTWTDISGNANNATLVNSPTYDTTYGGSIVFYGTNTSAIVTNPAVLRNQNFTISTWIYPLTQTAAIITIADFHHAGSPFQGWVIQSEGATSDRKYYLAYWDGSAFQPAGNFGGGKGIQITNGTWQNFVYTKNGTSVIGYLNGEQVFTATAGNANVSYLDSRQLRIGNCVTINRPFNGNIATTQIYSRALSSSEVIQNFNATRARYGV
jgi:hypothetical protein